MVVGRSSHRLARWGLIALVGACAPKAVPKPERPSSELGTGLASFYGEGFDGKLTANGEKFDRTKLTAAHRTLPFGTCLRVTSLETGRTVKVRVNDRGPYVGGRLIDLSEGAARALGIIDKGVSRVQLQRCE